MCRTSLAVAAALLALLPGISAAQTVNMGDTFHAIEARARRVTTTFSDAVVDVRRDADKSMSGQLRSRDGQIGGRLHVPGGTRRVQWSAAPDAAVQEFTLPDQATVSLDWVAHQLYALHADARDAAADGRPPEIVGEAGTWDGHVRRNRRALARGASVRQLAARLEAVETEFEEVVVRATLDTHVKRSSGKKIDYSKFTASLHDPTTGTRRGFVRWFDTAQVLTWKIEGGSQGVILPDRLPNGWTFTPTMEWANVQAYQFLTQVTRTLEPVDPFAQAIRGLFGRPAERLPLAQLARAVAPVPSMAIAAGVAASRFLPDTWPGVWKTGWSYSTAMAFNEPGCDRLHWLDGSIFRVCCDVHDRCYEAGGCGEKSWFWPFAGSWSCQKCNIQVTTCFCTLLGGCAVGSSGGDGGADGGGCTSVAGGFCPIECQTCQAQ